MFLFIKKKLGVAAAIPTLSMLWYSVDNAVVGQATARKVTALRRLPHGSNGAAALGERTSALAVPPPHRGPRKAPAFGGEEEPPHEHERGHA